MKLKIDFDNGLKGKDSWGYQGILEGTPKTIRKFLEVLIENVKKQEKKEVKDEQKERKSI